MTLEALFSDIITHSPPSAIIALASVFISPAPRLFTPPTFKCSACDLSQSLTMSPRKRVSPGSAQAQPTPDLKDPKDVLKKVAPKSRLARIPSPARFSLVVLGSLILSSVLFTSIAGFTKGDLGLVSKHLEEWWEVGGLIAWRGVEVALPWLLGFDGTLLLSMCKTSVANFKRKE